MEEEGTNIDAVIQLTAIEVSGGAIVPLFLLDFGEDVDSLGEGMGVYSRFELEIGLTEMGTKKLFVLGYPEDHSVDQTPYSFSLDLGDEDTSEFENARKGYPRWLFVVVSCDATEIWISRDGRVLLQEQKERSIWRD